MKLLNRCSVSSTVMGWRRCLDLIRPALGETDSDKPTEWQGNGWIY